MGTLLSFDPKKYSPWQRRTFYCCAFMFVLSVVLATVGVVFVVLAEFFGIKSIDLMPGVVLGGETLVAGIVGIVVALSGIIGAKDPRKITLFFCTARYIPLARHTAPQDKKTVRLRRLCFRVRVLPITRCSSSMFSNS